LDTLTVAEASMNQKHRVHLTASLRLELERLISEGSSSARKLSHARILMLADEGRGGRHWNDPDIVQALFVGKNTVRRALELSTNQITHFYSTGKNTEEMLRLLEVLLTQYRTCTRLFLSWDAAGWHASKRFFKRVQEINCRAYRRTHRTPRVELAPLPSRAQFLNVIESVFSGMAASIIHHSNYPSMNEAKVAIDRYFAERNEYFRNHPKRAGNKIWGKERMPISFGEGQNCKNPRFR